MVGERREDAGHHAHLYVAGHFQLAFDGCLRGGGLLQHVNVVDNEELHVAERIAELSHLVTPGGFWDGLVEVARGDALCLDCELLQGL